MSQFNNMIVLGSDKKNKKGDGISAVLGLMQDMRDFQDKVVDCMEAQSLESHKQKIAAFDREIDKMYDVLLGIAEGGIRSIREMRHDNTEEVVEDAIEDVVEEVPAEEVSEVSEIEVVESPVVRKPKAPTM